ncbi:hypothetical protein [Alteromonas oceanisediminis]|uniref:hypothetical protein n=1 Tax=Alteromonas oceanisediminis TaxID=2836180 RepID=UPI001BD9A115|nr:hypothetical protein [Alteromonas oceanisediminis]MBT0586692.1 hypothetical protein [Alteromonas oceanisediminis]
MNFKQLSKISAIAVFTFFLAACGDDNAEEAGEKIDEIVTDAGNAVEDACEDVKEGVEAKDQDC